MNDNEKLRKLAGLWVDLEGYIRAATADYKGSAWDDTEMEAGSLESFESTREDICQLLGVSYEPLKVIQKRIDELAKSAHETD
jgi:hypothetical protein